MRISIQNLLSQCGMDEPVYPGKRAVKRLPQPGESKSHCVVFDWRRPDLLMMEIKAGLTGKTLTTKDMKKYPLSFHSPTYVEFAIHNEHHDDEAHHNEAHEDEDESEDGEGARGKGGSGGRGLKKRTLAFSEMVRGKIPEGAEVQKMVLMGKEIAKGAFEAVLGSLMAQIKAMSVAPVNLLASVTHVTKIAPGGRPANEVDPTLLRGTKKYVAKPDMFGPPVT